MTNRKKTYCSHFEDAKLLELFNRAKIYKGFYVDIGANDGVTGSNSLLLEESGWNGLLVEPNPCLHSVLNEKRKGILVPYLISKTDGEVEFNKVEGPENLHGLSRIDGDENFEKHVEKHGGRVVKLKLPCKPLTQILDDNQVDKKFDFLSIDVEGHELDVLKTLNFDKYSPKVIMLEDNSKGEDKAPAKYLKQFGYKRVCRTGVNDWYTKELVHLFTLEKIKSCFTHYRWDLKRKIYKLLGKKFESGLV